MEEQFEIRAHQRGTVKLYSIYKKNRETALDVWWLSDFSGIYIMDMHRKMNSFGVKSKGRDSICEFPSKVKAEKFLTEWFIPNAIANKLTV